MKALVKSRQQSTVEKLKFEEKGKTFDIRNFTNLVIFYHRTKFKFAKLKCGSKV